MDTIKVLVADDHYIVRLGLKILIDSFDGFEVVLDVQNGQEVINNIAVSDYFILDLEMPVVSGVEALAKIRQDYPEKKVILLTNCMDLPTLIQAKKLKPNGFLFKDGMHEEIKICLNELKKGNYYTGRNCQAFFERHKEDIMETESLMRDLKALTKTELRVLYKISENLSTSEIAEVLFNSPKTIDNHRTNIAKKLDISGYNNLQAIAINHKSLIESFYNSLA